MDGEPINELNQGLKDFYDDIQNDSTTTNRLEIAIVEFSDKVNTLIDPTLVHNFSVPTLTTKGNC